MEPRRQTEQRALEKEEEDYFNEDRFVVRVLLVIQYQFLSVTRIILVYTSVMKRTQLLVFLNQETSMHEQRYQMESRITHLSGVQLHYNSHFFLN